MSQHARLALALAVGICGTGITFAAPAAAEPFDNCTQAHKAGYCDIPSDSPYYGPWLDRDKDGIACEC